MSAMIWVQYGPITIAVRATTRTPASGPLDMMHRLSSHSEAVADVVAVPRRHDGEDHRVGCVADGIAVFGHVLHSPRWPVHPGCLGNDGAGDPARDRDEDLTGDLARFVRQPAD